MSIVTYVIGRRDTITASSMSNSILFSIGPLEIAGSPVRIAELRDALSAELARRGQVEPAAAEEIIGNPLARSLSRQEASLVTLEMDA